MDGGFGDDVGVETVAEVDWVDVVAFQVRVPELPPTSALPQAGCPEMKEMVGKVHYCEEDLHKEVDCI